MCRIKNLRRRGGACKWSEQAFPGIVQISGGNLSLPHQDFPEADVCLQGADGIRSHCAIGNTIHRVAGSEETRDGLIIQIVKFGKNEVLIVELRELIGKKPHCLRTQTPISGTRAVDFREGQKSLQRAGRKRTGKSEHTLYKLLGIVPASGFVRSFGRDFRISLSLDDLLPDFNIGWNEWFAF